MKLTLIASIVLSLSISSTVSAGVISNAQANQEAEQAYTLLVDGSANAAITSLTPEQEAEFKKLYINARALNILTANADNTNKDWKTIYQLHTEYVQLKESIAPSGSGASESDELAATKGLLGNLSSSINSTTDSAQSALKKMSLTDLETNLTALVGAGKDAQDYFINAAEVSNTRSGVWKDFVEGIFSQNSATDQATRYTTIETSLGEFTNGPELTAALKTAATGYVTRQVSSYETIITNAEKNLSNPSLTVADATDWRTEVSTAIDKLKAFGANSGADGFIDTTLSPKIITTLQRARNLSADTDTAQDRMKFAINVKLDFLEAQTTSAHLTQADKTLITDLIAKLRPISADGKANSVVDKLIGENQTQTLVNQLDDLSTIVVDNQPREIPGWAHAVEKVFPSFVSSIFGAKTNRHVGSTVTSIHRTLPPEQEPPPEEPQTPTIDPAPEPPPPETPPPE